MAISWARQGLNRSASNRRRRLPGWVVRTSGNLGMFVLSMTTPTPVQDGGRGVFASVLASRGTRASPEKPFVIEHREALYYMLCIAAELEHGIMCQYLYAAFSLKQSTDEGLTDAQ